MNKWLLGWLLVGFGYGLAAQGTNIRIQGPAEICINSCGTYSILGLDPINGNPAGCTVNWLLSDGTSQSGFTLDFCPTSPGLYTITAQVACVDLQYQLQTVVSVSEFYEFDILTDGGCPRDSISPGGQDCDRVCAGAALTYTTDLPDSLSGKIAWQVSGGTATTLTGNSITVSWGEPGFGFLSASYSGADDSLCVSSASTCVEIIPLPVATLTANPAVQDDTLRLCAGQPVQLESQSEHAAGVFWNLGNGQTASSRTVQTAYDAPGIYTLQLVAFNACGCPDTTRLPVQVDDRFAPQLDCRGTVCTGDTVTYTASGGCGTYLWTVTGGDVQAGGGPTDDFITIIWTASTQGQIELLAQDCPGVDACPTPSRFDIPVLSPAVQIEGPQQVCRSAISTYSVPGYQGTRIQWDVSPPGLILSGQGSPEITVQWPAFIPGADQWVSVLLDNCYLECGGQGTLPVSLLPGFRLEGPPEVCRGDATSYQVFATDGMTYDYNWQLLDPSGGVLWTASGANSQAVPFNLPDGPYVLEVAPADPALFCQDRARLPVWVHSVPDLDSVSGVDLICLGNTYTYTAHTPASGAQVEWTVEDGSTSYGLSGPSVNVSWSSGGPYRLQAIQRSPVGCTSPVATLDVSARTQLEVLGPALLCQEAVATYEATSVPGASYNWSITPASAGQILNGTGSQQVEVLWAESGPATLQVSACGLTASTIVQVADSPEPEVLPPAQACPGETTVVSTILVYDTYAWYDAGGLLLSNAPSPALGPGNYRLEVTTADGCPGQTNFTIGSFPPAEVRISTPDLQSVCNGSSVSLFAHETGTGYNYQWFQDGNPVGPDASLFSTNQVGTYWVEITDANGCTAISNTLNLQNCTPIDGDIPSPPGCPPPNAVSFTFAAPGDCNEVQFTNTTANGIAGSWLWSFNDPDSGPANTSVMESPTHTFTGAGYYRVFLQGDVETPSGDTVTCATVNAVAIPLAADFTFADACPDVAVPFEDASTFLPGETITSWAWDFGDPASGAANNSGLQNPDHLFSGPGTYAVTLVVTGSGGCTARRSKTITIFDRPAVDFPNPPDTCVGSAVLFSGILGPEVINVEWDFGDPVSGGANTSSQPDAQHLFSTPGTYAVSLEAEDIRGCRNTVTRTIGIQPNTLGGVISQLPSPPLCEGDSLLQQAPPGGTNWEWSDGSTGASIWVQESGLYAVTISDDLGCTYAAPPVSVDLLPAPVARIRAVEFDDAGRVTGFRYDSLEVCAGQDVRLEIEGSAANTFSWSNGESGPALSLTPAEGTYDFAVTVTDPSNGCAAVSSFRLIVHPRPAPPMVQASSPEPRCPGTDHTFEVINPQPGLDYQWNNGQNGPAMTTRSGGRYFVRATNTFGCSAESPPLRIANPPDFRSIPAGCVSRCGPDSLCVSEVPGVDSYQWLQEGVPLGAAGSTVPELIVLESGTYTLEMTDTSGCVFQSDPLTIELYQGLGHIRGGVYVDVNNNGILDGPDTLHSGTSIRLLDGNSAPDSVLSQGSGYAFPQTIAGWYGLELDTATLPPWLQPYYTQVDSNLLFCGDTILVDWLLRFECPVLETTDSLTFCQGQGLNYQGITIRSDTSFTWMTTTSYGCDSTVQVIATSLPPVQSQLQLEACTGSSVTYQGETLLPGELRSFTLVTADGCDSVIQVEVVEIFPSDTSLTLWACPGETVDYAGTPLTAGQQQTFALTAVNGCDSLVDVTVSEAPVFSSELELMACPGEPVIYLGEELQAGEQRTFTFTSSLGCDSSIRVQVNAYPELALSADVAESCTDIPTGTITAQATSGAPGPFAFSLDGGPLRVSNVFENVPPGFYALAVQDGNGCRSETEVVVPARAPLEVFVPDYAFPCDAGQLLLQPQVVSGEGADLEFRWMDGMTTPERMVYAPGDFSLTVSNRCESRGLDIAVPLDYSTYQDGIYVPNAFSPNEDGRNDRFQVFPSPEVVIQEFELQVFDRWGNLMTRIRDPQAGWDGTHNGRIMNSAVFVWWLRARIVACGQEVEVRKQGDVLLVR